MHDIHSPSHPINLLKKANLYLSRKKKFGILICINMYISLYKIFYLINSHTI